VNQACYAESDPGAYAILVGTGVGRTGATAGITYPIVPRDAVGPLCPTASVPGFSGTRLPGPPPDLHTETAKKTALGDSTLDPP